MMLGTPKLEVDRESELLTPFFKLALDPNICTKPPTGCHLDKDILLCGQPFLTSLSPSLQIEFAGGRGGGL